MSSYSKSKYDGSKLELSEETLKVEIEENIERKI